MTNEVTILPGSSVFLRPVITPASTSCITPSESISVCTPRSCAVAERGEHGVGDPADADLQRGAVGDQRARPARPIARVDLVERLGRALGQRRVDRHQPGDAVDVEERVAERARHLRVDLGDARASAVSTAARTMSTETPRLT